MHKINLKILASLCVLLFIIACNTFQYKETNKFYKRQAKQLVKKLPQSPIQLWIQ